MDVHDYMRRLGDLLAVTEIMIKERDDALVDQKLIEELWERRTDATEMQEQIKLLRKERDEARRERDEARRLACRCSSSSGSASESLEEAQLRGWDCFKEENHNA